jgi:hypothetical protein
MVGSETPKIQENSLRGIPPLHVASIFSLRSFAYGSMLASLARRTLRTQSAMWDDR